MDETDISVWSTALISNTENLLFKNSTQKPPPSVGIPCNNNVCVHVCVYALCVGEGNMKKTKNNVAPLQQIIPFTLALGGIGRGLGKPG